MKNFSPLNMRRGKAFTLIEILIAIAILASLTLIAWRSINQMFITQDIVTERYERYRMARLAMNRMANELSMAYIAGPEHGGEVVPGEEMLYDDDENDMMWRNRDPIQFGMIGRSDYVHFTSFAHVRILEDEKASHHAQIGYFLERGYNDDGELIQRLMRRSSTDFDRDLTRGGTVYVMVPEVEGLRFEYWDPGESEFGTDRELAEGRWVNEWDTTRSTHAGRLPPRIRITLTMPARGPRDRPENFVTQTTLEMTELLEY